MRSRNPSRSPHWCLSGAGGVQLAPLSLERATRMSLSVPIVRQGSRSMTIRRPSCPRRRSSPGARSRHPSRSPRWLLSGAGTDQRPLLPTERATRMSLSVPIVPKRESFDSIRRPSGPRRRSSPGGSESSPSSVNALVLSGFGAVHVAPLLLERAIRMSKSVPIARESVRLPDGNPVARAVGRHLRFPVVTRVGRRIAVQRGGQVASCCKLE